MDRSMEYTRRHEGYKGHIYRDHLGHLTGGYGCHLYEGKRIPAHIWERLFWQDYYQAYNDFCALKIDLDPVRQAAILDMVFNMGIARFKGFEKLISALGRGDWNRAADEIMDSEYAEQVPNRAKENAEMVRTGRWQDVRPDGVEGAIERVGQEAR